MKKIYIFLITGLFFQSTIALAHPPLKIDLEYKTEDEALFITAPHTSRDRREHYLRKLIIYKNNDEPLIKYFTRQPKPEIFETKIKIQAEAGDIIRVELYCNEGGSKEAKIIIPDEDKENEK